MTEERCPAGMRTQILASAVVGASSTLRLDLAEQVLALLRYNVPGGRRDR